jgi:RHS repeat-associated protein
MGNLRSHNKANEIDTDDDHSNAPGNSLDRAFEPCGGDWVDPKYDAAGNMIQMPKAVSEAGTRLHLVYDAWNRLAETRADDGGSPGTTIATYRYDGLGRRIRKLINGGDTFDYYYNEGYQLIETRKDADGDPFEQYAWDISYIDAPLVRWHDGDTDGTVNDTLWPTRDANFNVMGLFDGSGTAVTRYVYNPYGRRIRTYDDEGNHEWTLGHQGLMHDTETNLVYNRARMLHTTLARFLQRDPAGYVDGMNRFEAVRSSPVSQSDAFGNCSKCKDSFGNKPWDMLGQGCGYFVICKSTVKLKPEQAIPAGQPEFVEGWELNFIPNPPAGYGFTSCTLDPRAKIVLVQAIETPGFRGPGIDIADESRRRQTIINKPPGYVEGGGRPGRTPYSLVDAPSKDSKLSTCAVARCPDVWRSDTILNCINMSCDARHRNFIADNPRNWTQLPANDPQFGSCWRVSGDRPGELWDKAWHFYNYGTTE